MNSDNAHPEGTTPYRIRREHGPACAVQFGWPLERCNCAAPKPVHISTVVPTVMEEIKVVTASLPAVPELEKQLEGLTRDDLDKAIELAHQVEEMQTWDKLTSTRSALASEAMHEASRIREIIWNGDTTDVQKAYELHRSLTAKRAKRVSFFDRVIALSKSIIARYDTVQREIADAKRRAEEESARLKAEADKQAEVDARLAEAAAVEQSGNKELAAAILEEAQDAAAAPVIPVAAPEVAPPKTAGASTTYRLVGTVRDPVKYLCFLLNVPYTLAMQARADLVKEAIGSWSQSGVNAQVRRGLKLQDHGVDVVREPMVRKGSQR